MNKIQQLMERVQAEYPSLSNDEFKARILREVQSDPDLIAEAVEGTVQDVVNFDAELVRRWLKSGLPSENEFASALARMRRH